MGSCYNTSPEARVFAFQVFSVPRMNFCLIHQCPVESAQDPNSFNQWGKSRANIFRKVIEYFLYTPSRSTYNRLIGSTNISHLFGLSFFLLVACILVPELFKQVRGSCGIHFHQVSLKTEHLGNSYDQKN